MIRHTFLHFCSPWGPLHRFRETAKSRERSELKAVETKAKDMLRLPGRGGVGGGGVGGFRGV